MIVLPTKAINDSDAIEAIEAEFDMLGEKGILYLRARHDHITGLMGERGLTWDEVWMERTGNDNKGEIVRVFLTNPEPNYSKRGLIR